MQTIGSIYLDMHINGVAELISVKRLKVKLHVFIHCLFAYSVSQLLLKQITSAMFEAGHKMHTHIPTYV